MFHFARVNFNFMSNSKSKVHYFIFPSGKGRGGGGGVVRLDIFFLGGGGGVCGVVSRIYSQEFILTLIKMVKLYTLFQTKNNTSFGRALTHLT